jgi:hypothetical protein
LKKGDIGGFTPGLLEKIPPYPPEAVKKSGSVFFLSFRRKPESSSIFEALTILWTPVFTGVTNKRQFFRSFPFAKGGKLVLDRLLIYRAFVPKSAEKGVLPGHLHQVEFPS